MKFRFLSLFIGLYITLLSIEVLAQTNITVYPNTQRFIGDVSTFDRSKYLQAHIWFGNEPNDVDFKSFKSTYNIDENYIGSRRFWSPLGLVKNGVIPNIRNNYSGVRSVNNHVDTGRSGSLMYDENVDYSTVDITDFSIEVAEFVAKNYRDEWNPVPKYIEPFNEPMIHAADHYPGSYNSAKTDEIVTKICQFHQHLGKAVRDIPELDNMKVIGYASAWPEFENGDFSLWNSRYKKFIDIAGEDIDLFSIHLYDGVGLNNTGGRRSGSNSEAILDLIEAYSFLKFGKVKPIAITEYGRLVADQEGWTWNNGQSNYHPIENSQAVRSQIHMAMSFMERGEQIEMAIPFSTQKINPKEKYSKAALWTLNDDQEWELTSRKYFFEIWKDVKGERVKIENDNVDVQSMAFVDDNKMYVVLNNLNDETQNINLKLNDNIGVDKIDIKQLKVYVDQLPELSNQTLNEVPESLPIQYGETIVVTYHFTDVVDLSNTLFEKKYYASTYLKPISSNTEQKFTIKNVTKENGFGKLRIGIGRDHGKSLLPTVKVNGQEVIITNDIIKGYDQSNRSRFFGVLEIPFDQNLLKSGSNEISVLFSDQGGHIASVGMIVNTTTKAADIVEDEDDITSLDDHGTEKIKIYPNPADKEINLFFNKVGKAQIKLFDLHGKLIKVYISDLQHQVIPTDDLQKGLYILKVNQADFIETHKILVK
ncbi:T9SS type A sorting domain-containing protein [Flammeovirga sp. MY04]|uniref:T9SS type A sorting domain-containing protein n=1 Tax=Flammeovirga sp. MY04 TaxID=1191459 RepID=UPI0008061971|nr:T9SS type A sorting domain-containing protein [Flammeovirga sp. MY04]ANQ52166.1 T9SS type A sorting domain-containing protein [Flammeovirga sp. MY04]